MFLIQIKALSPDECQEYGKYRYVTRWRAPYLPGEEGDYVTTLHDCISTVPLIPPDAGPAQTGEYPHMALIGSGIEFKNVSWDCEGVLISEKYIMSAAHCSFTSKSGRPRWALVGNFTSFSRRDNAKPKAYSIVKVHNHPNYKFPSFDHDISLFELNDTVACNVYRRPACLYTSKADLLIGRTASISGWEKISRGR
ncbi:serine protease snake-like [Planococcus citri]|uniref:serine protease snake-like n=1 Tax=Planococcus citri TaxID=170843 RepID=UPI0031F8D815